MPELEHPPIYSEMIERYALDYLKRDADLSLTPTGDLALTKDGDIKLGDGNCRVGGGRAFALPPSARSNGSCGFPASRFPVWSSPLTGDDPDPRHQMDQPDQSELVHQTGRGITPPRRVPPSPGDEGEQAPLNPGSAGTLDPRAVPRPRSGQPKTTLVTLTAIALPGNSRPFLTVRTRAPSCLR